MAEPKIDDSERKEGERTEAPADTGHMDTEPEEDVIPHSAKAIADYHRYLGGLLKDSKNAHGAVIKEMKKHHAAMEHMTARKHYGNWLQEHEESVDSHHKVLESLHEDMGRKFKKLHPDLEPLEDEEHEDEETNVAKEDKPTSEPRTSRSDRDERGNADKKSEPSPAAEVPVVTATAPVLAAEPPVETKTPHGLSQETLLACLGVLGQSTKELKKIRHDFAREVVG